MSYDEKPLGPNALLDEADDRAFREKHAADRRKLEQPARRPPAPTSSYVTRKELNGLLEGLGRKIRELVMDPLEKRIAALEAERGLKYVGPWKPGGDYTPGDFCSYRGSVWHCKQRTGTKPGLCPEVWQLAVKSGRDGKDAK